MFFFFFFFLRKRCDRCKMDPSDDSRLLLSNNSRRVVQAGALHRIQLKKVTSSSDDIVKEIADIAKLLSNFDVVSITVNH